MQGEAVIDRWKYVHKFIECLTTKSLLTPNPPVWVPGLRVDPVRLLAGCRKRRLNQALLNLRGII